MSPNSLPLLPRCGCEHAPIAIFRSGAEASRAVAAEIAQLIRERQREKKKVVLGLATGSTPLALYAELVRLHREERLSFANVVTFNLDEYHPLPPSDPRSYYHFMRVHLFDHIDVPAENIHIPSGVVPAGEVDAHCRAYEEAIRAAGGIDFQILGIGRTGHIGFNEPGSSRHSRTRLVTLDPLTRRDAAGDFAGEEHTPRHAITMGVASILDARRLVLMAWGQHKASIVREAVEGSINTLVTASFLQEHPAAAFVLDEAAAGALTRRRTPWLVGAIEDQGLTWDDHMQRRAIVWLSQTRRKAILKLTDDDYNDAGLQDLVRRRGSTYETNRAGFYQMQHTITGWPGGRDPQRTQPGDALVRPLRAPSAETFPKRILVLSPRPVDDVTAMGGTLCRLVEQGHDVHVAYQVSGSGGVSDEAIWHRLTFSLQAGLLSADEADAVKRLCHSYESEGKLPPSAELKRWKGLVRRHEAMASARVVGLPVAKLHFLNMPFYEDESMRSRQLGANDVALMRALLSGLKPQLIYAAGDLNDPHGTHRLCLRALREALLACAGEPWRDEAELWLYRGVWAGWELDEIHMAVPLSPQEVVRRRRAIFRHETQKDQAAFLGKDSRELWQRTDDRSRQLADAYNALGLAEYEAIEAFKRWSPDEFLNRTDL